MNARDENLEAWRSVAGGWERRRELIWTTTRPVAERLVDLLEPRPGQVILELAAGPGDTGFSALPRLLPGGRLVTTDVAPEMLDAARRRAAELGLEDVSFAVEDAAALTFDDDAFDGILCRWGLMLIPDMDAAAAEMRRVARPGGRVALAVWASPDANEWMTASGRAALELGLTEPPDPEAPGPFRLSGEGALEAVLSGAGLSVQALEDVPLMWHASSVDEWWEISTDMSRLLALLRAQLTDDQLADVRQAAERRLARYLDPDGTLAVPSLARVAVATA
jgi:SAM-dependent methyltransferase